MVTVLQILYVAAAVGLAVIGFNGVILAVLYVRNARYTPPQPEQPQEWPQVVVQLPTYNERHVVERLVEAASRLDYPADKLTIQLLDDSTDETLIRAAMSVEKARRGGAPIEHVLRSKRDGYKAGALSYGLQHTEAGFVAIFDADFVPQPDFLKRTIPHLLADPRVGMVQARWSHLNARYSSLTRAQSLALDAHFVVEQTARHRSGLMMNFAGTAGVWRRACIQESGGWQHDTLSEDIDLSYRAQLAGWRFIYLPDLGAPGEIPPLMMGFKRQQSRWATGTVQCLRKLGPTVLRSGLTPIQKLQAMLHLGGYFIHPLMIVVLLLTLPLILLDGIQALSLAGLGLAMFGPPTQALLSQKRLYRDWPARLLFFPVFMFMGMGIAVNNTLAVLRGFSNKAQPFHRTPKFSADDGWKESSYTLPIDGMLWAELFLGMYALVTAIFAFDRAPAVAPFMVLYALGFFYVALTSISQTGFMQRQGAQHSFSLSNMR